MSSARGRRGVAEVPGVGEGDNSATTTPTSTMIHGGPDDPV